MNSRHTKKRRLVIATWGDPSGWSYAKYQYSSREKMIEHAGFTSLEALAKIFGQDKDTDTEVIIVVLDTLYPLTTQSAPANYAEIKKNVIEFIIKFVCLRNQRVKINILVEPGVAVRPGRFEFRGHPYDFRIKLLSDLLSSYLKPYEEVILDMTHGINYMPATALQAVEDYTRILSFKKAIREGGSVNITLRILNSDPLIGAPQKLKRSKDNPCIPSEDYSELPTLEIHEVLKKKVLSSEILVLARELIQTMSISNRLPLKQLAREGNISKNDKKILSIAINEAELVLKMLSYGLSPILLSHASSKCEESLKSLEKAVEKVEELYDKVEMSSKQIQSLYRLRRLEEPYRALVVARSVLKAICNMKGLLSKDSAFKMETAMRLKDALKGDDVFCYIQQREFEKIKSNIKKIRDTWTRLSEIVGFIGSDISNDEVFRRDLIAHGGWHSHVIELRRTKYPAKFDDIEARVADNAWNRILSVLGKGSKC